MSEIIFSSDEKERIISKVKAYFNREFDQEIGAFDAEFLLDFFAEEIGAHFYNKGLSDAQQLFADRIEEIAYLVQELEKPTA